MWTYWLFNLDQPWWTKQNPLLLGVPRVRVHRIPPVSLSWRSWRMLSTWIRTTAKTLPRRFAGTMNSCCFDLCWCFFLLGVHGIKQETLEIYNQSKQLNRDGMRYHGIYDQYIYIYIYTWPFWGILHCQTWRFPTSWACLQINQVVRSLSLVLKNHGDLRILYFKKPLSHLYIYLSMYRYNIYIYIYIQYPHHIQMGNHKDDIDQWFKALIHD